MLLVIEGLDGSGKSTQLRLLQDFFKQQKKTFEYLHFPRLETPLWGDLVARFLRGEFGENDKVNPYLVALIYALDRNDAKSQISQWLHNGKIVILDRYVNSNIAYQCAKLKSADDRKKLADWILNMEYQYNQVPQPDLNIFLDVPFSFVEQKLNHQRQGNDREYLQGAKDIHESDLTFQHQVREVYHMLAKTDPKFRIIPCTGQDGKMLPPQTIFEKIKTQLLTENILQL